MITDEPINKVMEHLKKTNVNVEEGPIKRTGALGPILSVYIRDPDQNLIEISEYI
ncbi:glyoxalase/bleomycin resistance protein/dioxygenase [Bacillus subtilis XF-1]|nr:glyoxalase/bleomycin resistance protein/dioxygenase [Bacillus subtilis XF-1]AGI31234.1 glyoxalase/bleomycin resistance protein/dioxygenase [Bacillus subtilis subsp. subtilis str. BAB-1]ASK26148.1 glyoxalase/bleomycin resistance protein/dioxygenase [Bacillus subtilis]